MKSNVLIIDSKTENHFKVPDIEKEIISDGEVVLSHISSLTDLSDDLLSKVDIILLWACLPNLQFDGAFFRKVPGCRAMIKVAVGFDNINIQQANDHDIKIFNIPDYGTEEVADHSMALLLACIRKLNVADKAVKQNQWDWSCIRPAVRLRGKTLGIIGFGRIGSAVAQRAKSFGLNVQFYDPYVVSGIDKAIGVVRNETIEDLLSTSDFISINASLTQTSFEILNNRAFEQMKNGVIIVNTARGAVINTPSLVSALRSGKVMSAGLDVIQEEPEIHHELVSGGNVILTAHSAFYSEESFEEMRVKSASMAKDFLLGKSLRNEIKSPK